MTCACDLENNKLCERHTKFIVEVLNQHADLYFSTAVECGVDRTEFLQLLRKKNEGRKSGINPSGKVM